MVYHSCEGLHPGAARSVKFQALISPGSVWRNLLKILFQHKRTCLPEDLPLLKTEQMHLVFLQMANFWPVDQSHIMKQLNSKHTWRSVSRFSADCLQLHACTCLSLKPANVENLATTRQKGGDNLNFPSSYITFGMVEVKHKVQMK